MTKDYLAILKSWHSSVCGWSECDWSILGRYVSLGHSLQHVFFALPRSTPVSTVVIFSKVIKNNPRLWCVAVCRSMLQYVATCGSVLQCFVVCATVLYCVAVWCNVFQYVSIRFLCIAVHCRVLQCIVVNAVCYSVFQCFQVCSSVLLLSTSSCNRLKKVDNVHRTQASKLLSLNGKGFWAKF